MPSSGAEENLVSLRDVWFSFGNDPSHPPLFRGLSLEVRRGECLALIGPGGEGKTTLLKMMAGLIEPQRGTCEFDGLVLGRLSREKEKACRLRIGMTFQKSGLFDSLTVAENLDFPLREMSSMGAAERRKKIESALGEVGLAGQGGLGIHEISGGMQKRLGIARALLLSPELVLYDDPTAGLDPVTSRTIIDLIMEMKRKYRMTAVMVASDPQLAYGLADRIGFIYHGSCLLIGTPDEIRGSSHPVVKQFVEGSAEGPLTAEVTLAPNAEVTDD